MGRAPRGQSTGSSITVRMTAQELALVDRFVQVNKLKTRSDGLRNALWQACGAKSPPECPIVRLAERERRLETEPLQEDEVLIRFVDLSYPHDQETLIKNLSALLVRQTALHGWFYPKSSDGLVETMTQVSMHVVNGPVYSGMGRAGVNFLKANFPSFWETYRGPVDITRTGGSLPRYVKLAYDKSCETGKDLTLHALRMAFSATNFSFFRPAVAASIYRRWIKTAAPTVWDPSCGFGARMLGFFSQFPDGTYIGNEPARATYRDLCHLARQMPGRCAISQAGSEFAQLEENSVDFVFTSPPYFDTEKYFDEPGQVWVEYPDIETWREKHILPTMKVAYKALKPGCFMAINTAQEHRGTYIVEAQKCGFIHVLDEKLSLVKDHLVRHAKGSTETHTHEPILVFLKTAKEESV